MTGRRIRGTKGTTRDNDELRHAAMVIRAARVALGLSQGDLGDALSITFQQVQKYEKGVNGVPTGRVGVLCRVLGVTPNQLFGFDEAMPSAIISPTAIRAGIAFDRLPTTIQTVLNRLVDAIVDANNEENTK